VESPPRGLLRPVIQGTATEIAREAPSETDLARQKAGIAADIDHRSSTRAGDMERSNTATLITRARQLGYLDAGQEEARLSLAMNATRKRELLELTQDLPHMSAKPPKRGSKFIAEYDHGQYWLRFLLVLGPVTLGSLFTSASLQGHLAIAFGITAGFTFVFNLINIVAAIANEGERRKETRYSRP